MKNIEKELLEYNLRSALEHAKAESEGTFHLCAGDELKKILPKLIEFVEKFEVGDKVELEVRKLRGPITTGLPCKEKVELLMQRTEDQYEQIQALKKRVSDLEWKVGVTEKVQDLGWQRWNHSNPYYMNSPGLSSPGYTCGPGEVRCAAPTNDISRNMSDGSVNQRPADWSNHEPQTDAVPDSPQEREA